MPESEPTGSIPLIDVAPLLADDAPPAARAAADRSLHEALRDVGFAYIAQHGVPPALVEEVRRASRCFFELPSEVKRRYALNEFHRGYIIPQSSTVVTSSVGADGSKIEAGSRPMARPNQSESIIFLHELHPDDEDVRSGTPLAGPNQWPTREPGCDTMRATCLRYMSAMRALSMALVRSIARGLGLPAHHFDAAFARPTEFLRLLRFWTQEEEEGLYGSAPHSDYWFLTLVAQDDIGGLEVNPKGGTHTTSPAPTRAARPRSNQRNMYKIPISQIPSG